MRPPGSEALAIVVVGLQCGALLLASTVVFDLVHVLLHRLAGSPIRVLRRAGELHAVHHAFLDSQLRIDEAWRVANLARHVVPEYLTQLATVATLGLLADPLALAGALVVVTTNVVLVFWNGGEDGHHRALDRIPPPGRGWVVDRYYHAMHHAHPDTCFSSYVKVVDRILGTAVRLQGRRYAVTGAGGAFGRAMVDLLRNEGITEIRCLRYGSDYDEGDFDLVDRDLRDVDVLVLCHGSRETPMQANHDTSVEMIERFRDAAARRNVAAEVWAIGSEIEIHPAFSERDRAYRDSKRRFARRAARYLGDPVLVYRHIVPAAFRSQMGPGLISGRLAARVALFLIRRDFRYVPVTYTGLAFLNYFKFMRLAWSARSGPDVPVLRRLPGAAPREPT